MTTTSSAPTSSADLSVETSFEKLAQAVDTAAEAVAELPEDSRKAAEDLREAVEAIHKDVLVSMVKAMKENDAAREVLFELVDDPTVHLVLSLHGILRPSPMMAAQTALDKVRPQLLSHGGDVELVAIDGSVAQVRLSGACNGCSMSAVTLREGVEKALVEGVPGVESVEVLPSDPSPTVIPLSSLTVRPSDGEDLASQNAAQSAGQGEANPAGKGWIKTHPVEDVPDGEITPMKLVSAESGEMDVIVVRMGSAINAFKDECAHLAMPLSEGELDMSEGTLTCPWHGFCFDAQSGECITAPGATLEQLPLRIEDGHVWVRLGA